MKVETGNVDSNCNEKIRIIRDLNGTDNNLGKSRIRGGKRLRKRVKGTEARHLSYGDQHLSKTLKDRDLTSYNKGNTGGKQ